MRGCVMRDWGLRAGGVAQRGRRIQLANQIVQIITRLHSCALTTKNVIPPGKTCRLLAIAGASVGAFPSKPAPAGPATPLHNRRPLPSDDRAPRSVDRIAP